MRKMIWPVVVSLALASLAVAWADVTDWGGDDCRALASGDASYCKTDDCKGIAKRDKS
jgi:hypothetical protein